MGHSLLVLMLNMLDLVLRLLTSNLLHQHGLREGDRGAAASGVHGHHADLQTVTGGLVLDDVAARLLQLLVDGFPVLS